MRGLLFAAAFFLGCANASPTGPTAPRNRDLGGHLQFDTEDLAPAGADMAQKPDFSTGGSDMATTGGSDMAMGGPDMAQRDMAQAPADMAQGPVDMAGAVEYPIYVHNATTLYTLNPDTWALTTVGTFDAGESITDIAVAPNGSMVAISFTRIYQLNASTGKVGYSSPEMFTEINAAGYTTSGTLLVVEKSGDVWNASCNFGTFTTCTASFRGNLGSGATPAGDIQAVSDGTMYGLTETGPLASLTNNAFTRVNTSSGVSTAIGATGYDRSWGMAYSRGKAIAVTADGEIITIDPATGAGTVVKAYLTEFYGAATNPKVPK